MKILKFVLPPLVAILVALAIILLTPPKKAALKIDTSPTATVFINGKEVGKTPYNDEKIKPGDIDLKLVPEGGVGFATEKRLTLSPSTRVIIRKQFAANPEEESSQILYLEKTGAKDSRAVFTSIPDGVGITLDGEMRGFAPLNLQDLQPGEHKIAFALPGYRSEEIIAKTMSGYRLVVETKLARLSETEAIPPEENATPQEIKVVIKSTPTGWLRVRSEPSTTAGELARVKPGEKYVLLAEQDDWYKIAYEEGKEGWISSQYATKEGEEKTTLETTVTPSAGPTKAVSLTPTKTPTKAVTPATATPTP